jgi:ribose transport system permease protein
MKKSQAVASTQRRINLSEYVSLLAIIALGVTITIINPNFLGPVNLKNIATDITTFLIMGAGLSYVLILGSIDLSVGGICSFAAVLCATLVSSMGAYGFIIVAAFGILAGLLNGVLHVNLKIPSFIATLGTMSVWKSAALVLSNSGSVELKPDQYGVFKFLKFGWEAFTMPFIIGMAVIIISFFLLKRTRLGKNIFAIGANERAARMAGVPVKFTKITAFVICGLLAALVGILLVGKLKSASPYAGDALLMPCIAAVVLGGVSLSGGRGNPFWMIVGCGVIEIIQNGISVVGIPPYYQQVVYGLLLLVAIYITNDRSSRTMIVK